MAVRKDRPKPATNTGKPTRNRRRLTRNPEQNEALLSVFVRGVPAAVAMLDRDMCYLQASDRWCADYQLDREQLIGRSHYEIFPEVTERWKELHRRGLSGETLREEEDLFERPHGRSIWLRWEIRPWGDREGSPEGILIFSEDITTRKEMENTLRAQRDRLDKILATAPGAICAFRLRPDGSTSVPYSSAGFQKMLPELPDLRSDAAPLFAMMHPDDRERVRASIAESARALASWRNDFRLLTPARGTIWVEGHSVPEAEPDGGVLWYGFLTDITERNRMNEELGEKEASIRALFDAAAQGIVGVGPEGKIELVNRMAETIFGYKKDELLGQPVEKLLPEHLRRRHVVHRNAFQAMPGNRPMGVGLDLQGCRKDGSVFPIEVSLTHLQTSRGSQTVSFLTDITVRKQAELALRKSELELHELAGSLLTAQEDERRRIARDLHDDVTQELGVLSSEIDQLIMDLQPGESGLQKGLHSLLNRVGRVLNTVREVSHGLHPSIIEDLGLTVALRELCVEFGQAHEIAVRFEAGVDHEELSRSISLEIASCLYRIGQESLQNAAKHAQATVIDVRLDMDQDRIELTVSDDGVGFWAGDREAPGLGVVSMRERVRAVGGRILIHSQPGKGTEIRASVPTAKS